MSSTTSELDDLEHHLDLANKASLVGADSGQKAAALAAMTWLRSKFEALEAGTVGDFEATAEHRAEGHGSSVDWRKHHCREKGPAAARSRRLAGWLKELPGAREALAKGALTFEHVEVLARTHGLLGEDVFSQLEEALLDAAGTQRFCDFVRTVDYWVVRAAPSDAAERERRQVEDRQASWSHGPGGIGRSKSEFDALSFVPWQAEADRLTEHLLEEDRAEARDRLGRAPLASELERTPAQRRLDALRLMAERSSAFGDADLGPALVTLVAHSDVALVAAVIAVLRRALGQDLDEADFNQALDEIELGANSLHELDDGTVITVDTIILALLTGTVKGILYDPAGEILRYGRGRRLFSPPQAQALRAKYRRCCHPFGCDRTGRSLQADHRHEWDDYGLTDLDNGQVLCGAHNLWKTNHKHDPPPDNPDDSQRRTGPDAGPPPPTDD